METGAGTTKKDSVGFDAAKEEEYASVSKLLTQFTEISTIDKAWCFPSGNGQESHAMFLINQPNLLANKRRKSLLSAHILKGSGDLVKFQWTPFPIEASGVTIMVPSPSGSKLLVIRNSDVNDSSTHFEIWGPCGVTKEIVVPSSIHGSVYADGWFEGISWDSTEISVAYVAEEPGPPKPMFSHVGYKKNNTNDNEDCTGWKGQGDWEEDWGEAYTGKRQPALFLINVYSGEVCPVEVLGRQFSVGQVIWAPPVEGQKYLVFVGWPSARKLGIKYCYNRPCALYAIKAPSFKSETSLTSNENNAAEDQLVFNLTQSISSAFFPRFSPDGKFLVFFSAKSAVDSGAHMATDSLHKIEWPSDGKFHPSLKIDDVVPVVMCPEDGSFPGLYCSNFMNDPWLSDGRTIVISSVWGSIQTILSVNILSGEVSRMSPDGTHSSWDVLALDGENIIAECSSPVDTPQIKYGILGGEILGDVKCRWLDISSMNMKCSEKVISCLESMQFSVLKIPVMNDSVNISQGARNPFEAIYVSSKSEMSAHDPLIVILHGGPHDVSVSSFSKSSAFLGSLGFSLLIVNYRGSRGFGEQALQSLPGKVGSQDVNDVLTAIDHVIDKGLANPSKIAVVGISHGGFLTTHLIGQAPERFAAAAARNPVCSFASMVGTSDIPDWCFVEAFGHEGKSIFTESPSSEHLAVFHSKSPIAHISKVKTPTLFLLGAQDIRVPASIGIQYARALKERGVVNKVIVFPKDIHPINRPQSDFESFLNIGVWFKRYCK